MMSNVRSIFRLFVMLVLFSVTMGATISHEEALFLTPYVERGDIHEGQKAARNPNFFGDKESYSGYLTVNKTTNANLFFWYFKSETAPQDAPVILWLQGGPGASSLVGAFLENGPYKFNSKVEQRKYYWSQRFHVIYIDNPVGTGYSFTDGGGYAVDESEIGITLYDSLTQFFMLFPELRRNDFYVAGESYAGKYVPALAFHIYKNNQNATNYIKLRGIALGNPIIDPMSQIDNGDLYYQLGILDDKGLRKYKIVVEEARKYIMSRSWKKASDMYLKLFDLTYDASRLGTLFNLVKDKNDIPLSELEELLNTYWAKRALHVGQRQYLVQSTSAYENLLADRAKSVKAWFLNILENYDVLVYNGQLDLNKPYSGIVNFMSHLKWSGSNSYKTAPRHAWTINGDVAGYSKTLWHRSRLSYKPIKFMEVLIRNAGHLVPSDQPHWAMTMMLNFTGVRTSKIPQELFPPHFHLINMR